MEDVKKTQTKLVNETYRNVSWFRFKKRGLCVADASAIGVP